MSKIGQAAISLFKGDITGAFKSLSANEQDYMPYATQTIAPVLIDPRYYSGANGDVWEAERAGGSYQYFKYKDYSSCGSAYMQCPPLQAVINRKAQAFINGKTWFLNNSNDKESQSSQAAKLRALFKNPNPIQTQKQFESQMYIFMQLFGYSILYFVKPSGSKANIDAYNMWNIPPSMLCIEETDKLFNQTKLTGSISEIKLKYKDIETTVDINDIYILRDITPSFNSMIVPDSRCRALSQNINNIVGALDSRGQLVFERGALGIFTQAASKDGLVTMPMPQEEKDQLQRDMRTYGTRRGQKKFIITKTAIDWKQVGIPVAQLMLFEEIEADTMSICDSYNYDYRLMANAKANSLGGTDADIFLRKLYHDTIIPEAETLYEQLGQCFGLEAIRIDKDYKHVPVLQEDQQKAAAARMTRNQALEIEWLAGLITLNYWKVQNGDDPVTNDPTFEMYYPEWAKINITQNATDQSGTGQGQAQQGQQGGA